MSDTMFSSGYALPGNRAGSLLDRFQDSAACRKASAAIAEARQFGQDVWTGMKADRFAAFAVPGLTLASPAASVLSTMFLASRYPGLDDGFIVGAGSLSLLCVTGLGMAANAILNAEEKGQTIRTGATLSRPQRPAVETYRTA